MIKDEQSQGRETINIMLADCTLQRQIKSREHLWNVLEYSSTT